tara:strand:+ start:6289 stop:6531 length:243 start_codon:yes stop_codon:yes gene_type:complete
MSRINIWTVYSGVAHQLKRSLNAAKRDGTKVTARFVDREIKEIIKDEAIYWGQGGDRIPKNINMTKARKNILRMVEDDDL